MTEIKDHLRDLSEIRNLMEQHSKFLSLSGLSGVSAGLCALAGTGYAWAKMGTLWVYEAEVGTSIVAERIRFLLVVAALVLVAAVGLAVFFSLRLARKRKLPTWNNSAKRLLASLGMPLAVGAAFCLIQYEQGMTIYIPACTLLFYGLALLNASKHTVKEIRLLGYSELVLGLVCAAFWEAALPIWMVGFGLLHIVYGILMYYKYER
jgi:hypothetical protein